MTALLSSVLGSAGGLTLASARPFIDPISLHGLWFVLLVPLSFGVAVTYRGVRVASLEQFWWKVIVLTVQIVVSLILLGLASYVFIQWLVPMLAPMPE